MYPIQKLDSNVLERYLFEEYPYQEMGASNFRKAFC
jgi:hypothetical protein